LLKALKRSGVLWTSSKPALRLILVSGWRMTGPWILPQLRSSPASRTEIERQLCNRRRQTAVSTYCYLAGGAGFLALWTCEALLEPTYASLPYIVALIGLCGVFFLSAFYNALVNWQARTLRLGTAREFLATDDSWWPS
jgi:hypothetical protein